MKQDVLKCLQRYIDFVQHFCYNCIQKPDDHACTKKVLKKLQNKLNKNISSAFQQKAVTAYQVFCKFDNILKSNRTFLNFDLFVLILKFPDANSVESVVKQRKKIVSKMENFISEWISIPNQIGERKIFEITLKIIAFHYVFFYDLMNNTIFCNTPEYDPNRSIYKSITDTIEAFIWQQKGKSESDIYKILNDKVNYDELINLGQNNLRYQPELNNLQISQIMEKILKIYDYEILEHVSYSKLPTPTKRQIKNLLEEGKISRANVIIDKKSVTPGLETNQKNLDYIIIVKFVSLLESMKRTRFTNKLPALFEKDNLIKLFIEMYSDDLDEVQCTLAQACRKLNFKYKATHMALYGKLMYHPIYEYYNEIFNQKKLVNDNYNKLHWVFEQSSKDDIEEWINNVRKLKK